MASLIRINGKALPNPSSYLGEVGDVTDNGRNTCAVMIGSVIREDVGKVSATWNYLTKEEWSYVLKFFNSKFGGAFVNDVTFFDQVSCSYVTRKMYPGNRTASMSILDEEGNVKAFEGCKLNLIEV